MRKWKWLFASCLALCLGLTGMLPMTVRAEESEVEGNIGEAASMEDSFVEIDDKLAAYSVGSNISGITFNFAEVRTPSNTRTFNGGDGKYHIIMYGGVSSCGNTNSALGSLSELTAYMDLNQVEINVFDIKDNSSENIIKQLTGNNISADIKVCRNQGDASLFAACRQAANISSNYTMPLIAYVNSSGDIVNTTTGYTSTEAIQRNIESMGLRVDKEASYQVLDITGTADYVAAYQVLDLLNKDRAAAGLAALTMDPGLLESAMERAAECSLYYDHIRPNSENCYSIDTKMYRENIAVGYSTAASVEAAWMNSATHKANIMAGDNKSVGIGVFVINNTYYWTQCFSLSPSVNASQPANTARTYKIRTVQTLVDPRFKQGTLNLNKKGATAQFEVWVTNQKYSAISTRVDASSYNWSVDNGNFVIDANGTVKANKWGTANVTAVNKNNGNYNLYGSVTLSTNATVSNPGIFLAELGKDHIVAGMTYKITEQTDVEFSWYLSTDGKNWTVLQDWKENDEWLRWAPDTFGEYSLKCAARVCGNLGSAVEDTIPISFHPEIKGKCQIPYTGEGGGYLIGVETFENPNQSYQYEMLILDCTLLAQGKDAWIYSTGKFTVTEGCAGWTIWQPQYGYYWTLFRVYDANDKLIDEACYGFVNAY